MINIKNLLISLAAFVVLMQADVCAETICPSDELTYRVGYDTEPVQPIRVSWQENWMSISLFIARVYDSTVPPPSASIQAYVSFNSSPISQTNRPKAFSIRVQGEPVPLDTERLPDEYKDVVKNISRMSAMTLEKDQVAHKLSDEAVIVLEMLRDGKYSLSQSQGSSISIQWNCEYQGDTVTYSLNYYTPAQYCSINFTGDSFTLYLRNIEDFRTITATYNEGLLEGGFQRFDTLAVVSEKEALALLKSALKAIESVYSAANTPMPEAMQASLRLARKAIANGFSSFQETILPAVTSGGT